MVDEDEGNIFVNIQDGEIMAKFHMKSSVYIEIINRIVDGFEEWTVI